MPFSCAERSRKASLMTRKSDVRNLKSERSPNSEFPKDDCPAPIFGIRHSDFGFESKRRKAGPEGGAYRSCQSPPKIVSPECGPDVSFRLSALPIPGVCFRRRRRRSELRRANYRLSRLPPAFRRIHPRPAACGPGCICSRRCSGQVRPQVAARGHYHTASQAAGKCLERLLSDATIQGAGEAMALGKCKTDLSGGRFTPV